MKLVIDTNIVLDLFVFGDPAVAALQQALAAKEVQWFATAPMRDELAAVLAYENIGERMRVAKVSANEVLEAFDSHARIVDAAAPCSILCRDGDDQKFIDLAVAHRATLLSKDKQVLTLRRKLGAHEVQVAKAL